MYLSRYSIVTSILKKIPTKIDRFLLDPHIKSAIQQVGLLARGWQCNENGSGNSNDNSFNEEISVFSIF